MRIAHLSDLHFGRHDDDVVATLAAELGEQGPDLLVISGDFTMVGSEAEYRSARAFLDSLAIPVFAVPGNHDVPGVNLVRRFFDPYSLYRRYIHPETERFWVGEGVAIAGLKTTRRMRLELNWSHGSIGSAQLHRLARRFDAAHPSATRIVVAHHPLLLPEAESADHPLRAVRQADLALARFAELGVRLVLSGHFHLSYVRQHGAPGEVGEGAPTGLRKAAAAPILVAQASSTTSTRLRGQPNSYNLIEIDAHSGAIAVAVREWTGTGWTTQPKAASSDAVEASRGFHAGG